MKMFIDGSCSNNHLEQSKRKMGIVVTDAEGVVLVEKSLPHGSNNIAEFWAIAEALAYAKDHHIEEVHLYTDSKTNLSWLRGNIGDGVNDKTSVDDILCAINRYRRHVTLSVEWIPREQNLAGIYIQGAHR